MSEIKMMIDGKWETVVEEVDLTSKANDNAVVHLDNAEEISGVKTFMGGLQTVDVTNEELMSGQAVAPAPQIIGVVQQALGTKANQSDLNALSDKVTNIGVDAHIVQGSVPGKNAVSVTVNGKTSKTEDLPSGGKMREIPLSYAELTKLPMFTPIIIDFRYTIERDDYLEPPVSGNSTTRSILMNTGGSAFDYGEFGRTKVVMDDGKYLSLGSDYSDGRIYFHMQYGNWRIDWNSPSDDKLAKKYIKRIIALV